MNPRIEIAIQVEAAPSRVFDALTRAAELERWFAERAFVSAEEGRFDFWGRHTPGNPDRDAGRHLLSAFVPGERIGFRWSLRGRETTVEIALAPSSRGTRVLLTHDAPPRGDTEISINDFWLLSLENLRRHLEEAALPVRCDYSTSPRGAAELSIDIEAPPDAVFRALTTPADLDRWMTAKSSVEPVPGGRMSFGWKNEGPVRILSIVPDEKLSYSWAHSNDPETVVTWTLDRPNGRPATRLTLVHSGFGDRETEDFRTGWLKHVVWMKALLERGKAWTAPEILSQGYDA
jgi:uncharacterized protein YndB with AHSA1/START domain